MEWNRFDIADAWYLALSEWHGGQTSPEYRRLCKLTRPGMYTPSPLASVERLSENARAIYDDLTARLAASWHPRATA